MPHAIHCSNHCSNHCLVVIQRTRHTCGFMSCPLSIALHISHVSFRVQVHGQGHQGSDTACLGTANFQGSTWHGFTPHHHHDMAGTSTPLLHAGLASHQSLRPNYYDTTSASRVSSVATPNSDEKPSKHDKHKSHRHHHHSRRRDNEHRHSSSRRHAKDVVQSAIQLQPPTSFGDLLKQARGSKDTSPSHSRKGSIAPGTDGNAEGKESRDVGITITPRRPLRPADVELERKRVEARER
jgi:hypothetical protein